MNRFLCFALVAFLAGCSVDEPTVDRGAPIERAPGNEPSAVVAAELRSSGAAVPASTAATAAEVLSSPHSSLLALSAEEAAWLERNGYPTPDELEQLPRYDVDDLESAMRNRRDPRAATLLGHRRMMEGDVRGAIWAFARAADLGSLYARQQLAIASTQSATGLPAERLADADPGILAVMVAQFEVARMLGDHRAQASIDRYTADFDWAGYGRHILTQTAEFMRQYGESARAQGDRARGPDPRPNPEAWAALAADPNAQVTLYTRR